MSLPAVLEITRLVPERIDGLLALLETLDRAGESRFFAPHPFTREALEALCGESVRDLHYVLSDGTQVAGYGLLRGWDEGYEVPSLGIALHPRARGLGHAEMLMHFLHAAARARGARRVRLRALKSNTRALALYRRLGYRFEAESDDDRVVGSKELVVRASDAADRPATRTVIDRPS